MIKRKTLHSAPSRLRRIVPVAFAALALAPLTPSLHAGIEFDQSEYTVEENHAVTAKVRLTEPPSGDTTVTVRRASGDANLCPGTLVRFYTSSRSDIRVVLYDQDTPATVDNFLAYFEAGDYDGGIIHRSEPGFVIQGGGYRWTGAQWIKVPRRDPVVNEPVRSNTYGTIAMAKMDGDPDSATSEWFFNLADNSAKLDEQNGGFTAFGQVMLDKDEYEGMDVAHAIAGLPVEEWSGLPKVPYYTEGSDVRHRIFAYPEAIINSPNPAFTTDNWDDWQEVTVSAGDDVDTVDGTATLEATATGMESATATVTETDNDEVEIRVETTEVPATEGETASFAVTLSHQPVDNVIVTVEARDGDNDLTLESDGTLTFTPATWNEPQQVTLAAASDDDEDAGTRTFRVDADGMDSVDITATEHDTTYRFVANSATVSVPEEGEVAFSVTLSRAPDEDVTAAVSVDAGGDGDISVSDGEELVFTPENWNDPHEVTLAAADDADVENGEANVRCAVAEANQPYRALVAATEADDDTLEFEVVDGPASVAEGGFGAFRVRLTAQPSDDVRAQVVHVSGDADIVANAAVRVETVLGAFVVGLYDEATPLTVANFLAYVRDGDYDGSFFHRLVSGFVLQGGGYTLSAQGDIEPVPADAPVHNEPVRSNVRGTLALAKIAGDPSSGTCEWFINLADNSDNLDNQNGGFAAFGEVIGHGMEVVDDIAALSTTSEIASFDTLPYTEKTPQDMYYLVTMPTVEEIDPAELVFTADDWDQYKTVALAGIEDDDDRDAGTATLRVEQTEGPHAPPPVEITANEVDDDVLLTVESGGNGTVSPAGEQTVDPVSEVPFSVSATPNDGYAFLRWRLEAGEETRYGFTPDLEFYPVEEQTTLTAEFAPDGDRDGMPDSWETEHGLNPEDDSDGLADADGDGLSNLGEYEQGSDPNQYILELSAGWNTFALAGVPEGGDVLAQLLANPDIDGPVWKWRDGTYARAQRIEDEGCYWILAEKDTSVELSADTPPDSGSGDMEIALDAGWNAVAFPREPANPSPLDLLAPVRDSVAYPVREWANGAYPRARSLLPLHTYWIFAHESVTLTVPARVPAP